MGFCDACARGGPGGLPCGKDSGEWRKIAAYVESKGLPLGAVNGFRMSSKLGCRTRHAYGLALDIFGTAGDKSAAARSRIFDVLQPLEAAGLTDELLYTPRNGKGGSDHIGHIHVSVHPNSPVAAGMDLSKYGKGGGGGGGGNPLNPFAIIAAIIKGLGGGVFNADIARRASKIALGSIMVAPAAVLMMRQVRGSRVGKLAEEVATTAIPGAKVAKGAQIARQVTSPR